MKHTTFAAAGLIALVACATNRANDDPDPDADHVEEDGGIPSVDAGPSDGNTPDVDLDAERPLACGAAGFCETRIPTSDLGVPLSLRSVWVVASNDVWSVSAEGFVVHYDGTSWTTLYRAHHALYAVWGTATDVWVGGERGLLVRRSAGGEWTRVESGHVQTIRAISGTDANDVWFTSHDSSVDHFDGTSLTNHPIDVPGVRITTVFGRAGFGTYAAGYVEGPPSDDVGHNPYVFELSPVNISTFNTSLPEQKGFIPVSGVVTDSPDENHRVFMLGYLDGGVFADQRRFFPAYCPLGQSGPAAIGRLNYPPFLSNSTGRGLPDRPFPVWAARRDDILMSYHVGLLHHWNGSGLTRTSLNMGRGFVSRMAFAVHGNSTYTWIVGDGFALKGPTS